MFDPSTLQEEIESAVAAHDREKLAALEETARGLARSQPSAALIECLAMVATGWHHCGDLARNTDLSSFILDTARSFGDPKSIRRALNTRAGAADAEGQVGLALRHLTEAYRIAESIDDKPATIYSLANIATCCGRAGLLIHAQKCYQAARALTESARSALTELDCFLAKCVVLTGSLDSALNTGDLRQALHLAQQLRALKAEEPEGIETYDAYQTSVFIEQGATFELIALSRLGMLAEANAMGQTLSAALESESLLERTLPSARWALANLHAANGDLSTAISIFQGLVNAPDIHQEVRADLAACLRQAGRDDEAIRLWHELQHEIGESRQSIAMDELKLIDGIGPNEDVLFERTIDMAVALAESESAISSRLEAKIRFLTDIAISAELPELHDRVERHVEMVGQLASRLAAFVGCDSKEQWFAEVAGRLHDVGKCAIPERLRLKSTGLSREELELVRERASLGARLVEASNEPDLMPVADAIRNLHEHYDGSGYPARLKGDGIPLLARVVAICESFVAMTEPRPYRNALSPEAALAEVRGKGGRQFDPSLCSAFVALAASDARVSSKASSLNH